MLKMRKTHATQNQRKDDNIFDEGSLKFHEGYGRTSLWSAFLGGHKARLWE